MKISVGFSRAGEERGAKWEKRKKGPTFSFKPSMKADIKTNEISRRNISVSIYISID